jgi:hypothetical protein
VDKNIRRNENCIIGLPRCDFVFSSTRTCFIAFGFEDSPLEMSILGKLLEEKGIQPVEASGALAPAQNAFCAKICSKIITSQFCIVLINNEEGQDGKEIPNANVNMEYGLMLGFNKYVIPFQRSSQKLPFNVAGLDTVKYTNKEFEKLASDAIDLAISATSQESTKQPDLDQILQVFLMAKKALITPIDTVGDKTIYQMGAPLGFYLLNDFSAMKYMFLGNFTFLRPEIVLWRLKVLIEILGERKESMDKRIKAGIITKSQAEVLEDLLNNIQIWLIVTSKEDKESILKDIYKDKYSLAVQCFSLEDIDSELKGIRV